MRIAIKPGDDNYELSKYYEENNNSDRSFACWDEYYHFNHNNIEDFDNEVIISEKLVSGYKVMTIEEWRIFVGVTKILDCIDNASIF